MPLYSFSEKTPLNTFLKIMYITPELPGFVNSMRHLRVCAKNIPQNGLQSHPASEFWRRPFCQMLQLSGKQEALFVLPNDLLRESQCKPRGGGEENLDFKLCK